MNTAVQLSYNFNRTNRVLSCRPHVKAFYYFLTGAASLGLLLGLTTLATFGLNENQTGVFWSSIFGFGLPLSLLLLARLVIRPMAFTRVELKADCLIIRHEDHELKLNFKDVNNIRLSHIPFIAGWMKIVMKDGKSYALSVVLERSEYILDALILFNSKLASSDKVHHYRLTAIYYDHSWARLVDRVKNSRKLMLKYGLGSFLVPIAYYVSVIAQKSEAAPNIFKMILMMVGAFAFLVVLGGCLWFLSELLVLAPFSRRALKIDASRPVRQVEFEKRVELLADVAYFFIVVGCMIMLS